jgi:hypothetical protein
MNDSESELKAYQKPQLESQGTYSSLIGISVPIGAVTFNGIDLSPLENTGGSQ